MMPVKYLPLIPHRSGLCPRFYTSPIGPRIDGSRYLRRMARVRLEPGTFGTPNPCLTTPPTQHWLVKTSCIHITTRHFTCLKDIVLSQSDL
ncbi:hypothetical protein E3N88_16036 [Mikania micrantha]|uniref:Uncharacterized protein n=1 Tax=Mikania micrantha TaxID=192012 RepID=A0A5N6NZX2_9ASTR|nr:hypothetical protein E3N88_16036 [Mikania micrantha]